MIQTAQRTLTPVERAALIPRTLPLAVAWFWVYALGVSLVLVPFVLGGFLGALLHLVLDDNTASASGLGLGALAGLGVLLVFALARRAKRQEDAAFREHVERGVVEVLTLSHIERAWEVEDLEDLGPGLVLATADGQLAYFASQELLDHWSEAAGQSCPARTLTLERLKGTEALISFDAVGEPFEVEETPLRTSPLDLSRTCIVLVGEEAERVRALLPRTGRS